MGMPARKYTAGNSYRYGFNGKENDNEVKGEGNQQDYGMRIYDTRLGRFLSQDPITKEYPDLTPYQFASNRPIDGIDQDGLEFVKYLPNATGTVIFPRNRDKIIEKQYQKALKANMNVMVASTIAEMNTYFKEKGKKFRTISFGGHGPWKTSGLRFGDFTYSAKNIQGYSKDFKQLGEYLEKNGAIVLLACFQATPQYNEKTVNKQTGKTTEVNVNGEALIVMLSKIIGKDVVGNQAETRVKGMFEGTTPTGITHPDHEYANMNNKFAGHWSMASADGTVKDIGNIILNSDGSYTSTTQKPVSVDSTNKK
jgi:RHS repeat-associated protein